MPAPPRLKGVRHALFGDSLRPRPGPAGAVLILYLAWAATIYWAASSDGVLRLPDTGRGLLEHYGFLTCFTAGLLVLLNAYFAVAYFLRVVRDIDQYLVPGADAHVLAEITGPHVESILLKGRWKFMLLLFCVIGVAISFVIFAPLDRPATYWGNDVFNARPYARSYLAANAYLLFLWGLVYPLGLFYVFHIAISAQLIVAQLRRRKLLRLNFLHIDRCGGMARFGTLNVLIMLIYVWMSLAIWPLHLTHQSSYPSLIAGTLALSALLMLHSIYGIWWVARAIKSQRDEAVDSLNERIRTLMEPQRRSFAAAVAAMEYRDRVLSVASYPYSGGIWVAVNVLRFAPAAAVVARLSIQGLTTT